MAALEVEAALDRRVEEDDADGRERGIGLLADNQRAEHRSPDRLSIHVERAAGEDGIEPKPFGRCQIAALKVKRIQHHQHPMRRPGTRRPENVREIRPCWSTATTANPWRKAGIATRRVPAG